MDEKKKIPPLVEETHISPITDREIQAKLNVQRNSFQLTINNPLEDGFDHTTIKETLVSHFPTLVYFCMSDEVAETGTPHTHLYRFPIKSTVEYGEKALPDSPQRGCKGNCKRQY